MEFNEFLVESKVHMLSGVVLIYENKILLVRPKKFRRKMRKWSIPKGHVEDGMSKLKTALHELEEESRIKLTKSHLREADKYILNYNKAGVDKKLTLYVVEVKKNELNVKLFNNMILGNFLKAETIEAGFFSKIDAKKIMERQQLGILKFLK